MNIVQQKASFVLCLAGLLGAAAVIIGAFGAHGLKKILSPESLAIYHTGVSYHFYHVLALLLVGVWLKVQPEPSGWLFAGAICFTVGIVLFSGSLYSLAVSGIRWLGAITPVGGLFFILGWLALFISAFKES